jgi:hypothetical protein
VRSRFTRVICSTGHPHGHLPSHTTLVHTAALPSDHYLFISPFHQPFQIPVRRSLGHTGQLAIDPVGDTSIFLNITQCLYQSLFYPALHDDSPIRSSGTPTTLCVASSTPIITIPALAFAILQSLSARINCSESRSF